MNPQIYAKSEDCTVNLWISQCKSKDFTVDLEDFMDLMKYEDLCMDLTEIYMRNYCED